MKLHTSTSGHGSVRTTTVSGRIRQRSPERSCWRGSWKIATLWLRAVWRCFCMKQTLRSTSTRCTSWNRINVHILDARRCSELGVSDISREHNTDNPEIWMHCGRMRNDVSVHEVMTRHQEKVHEWASVWMHMGGCDKMFQARPTGTSISTLYILE
jgi:hypothetical protein